MQLSLHFLWAYDSVQCNAIHIFIFEVFNDSICKLFSNFWRFPNILIAASIAISISLMIDIFLLSFLNAIVEEKSQPVPQRDLIWLQ